MYGYEPRHDTDAGSWRETLTFVLVAFRVLVPIMLIIIAVMAGLLATTMLAIYDGRLALIPILLVVGAVAWYLRRERRKNQEEADRMAGPL